MNSPKNLAIINLSKGLMFKFFSVLDKWIPSSSHTRGKLSSTSPTICKEWIKCENVKIHRKHFFGAKGQLHKNG